MSSPAEDLAVKLVNEAVDNFKKRCMAELFAVADLTTEGDELRRSFVMQFRIADDVGKTVAVMIQAVKR